MLRILHGIQSLFNPTKRKIITFYCNDRKLSIPKIKFVNGVIEEVEYDKHLGNYVGNIPERSHIIRNK